MGTTHPHFEAIKIALKQDKTGYVLTLNIHPDDLDERILRDFVGARYQVVMVRIGDDDKPLNRDHEYARDPVRTAGILCRDKNFATWLAETGNILETDEKEVVEWLKDALGVKSRAELKTNQEAVKRLWTIEEEYKLWNRND